MIVVVDEFARQAQLKVKVSDQCQECTAEASCSQCRKPCPIWNAVFLHLDVCIGGEHATPDDEQVECHTERPFLGRPFNAKDGVKDFEDEGHDVGIVHKHSDESGAKDELADEEEGFLVVFVADPHGGVDDYVPPGYQWSKVVKSIVGVHGVWQDDRE